MAVTLLGYAALMTGVTSCHNSNANDEVAHHHHDHGHGHEDHDHESEEGHDHEHEGHDHEGHEGHDHGSGQEIVLEPERAKLLGVESQSAQPADFHAVIKAGGEILSAADATGIASAPAAGTVSFTRGMTEGQTVGAGALIATVKPGRVTGGDPNAAARAALNAAQREVDRLRPLHERGIVSTAEMNAALATLDAAKAAYSPAASTGRVTAPVSGTVTALLASEGQYVDAGAPIAEISSSNRLTLRVDVPQRHYGELSDLTGARIKAAYTDQVIDIADLGAKRQTKAGARARGGYIPVYFTFNGNGALMAGSAVEVFLQGSPRPNVISVPLSAVSEQQGNYFVYIQVDDEGYLKSPVTLGENDGQNVEILKGVHPGDKVVVKGMTAVRLAETSGVVPEGHTHTH